MRDLVVQGLACGDQVGQTLAGVVGLQQGAAAVALDTTVEFIECGTQINHHTTRTKVPTILRIKYRAPAGCQYNVFTACAFVQHSAFTFTEPLFTFDVENRCHANTTAGFQFVVKVYKLPAKLTRQGTPNGGFSGTHHAHQKHRLLKRQPGGHIAFMGVVRLWFSSTRRLRLVHYVLSYVLSNYTPLHCLIRLQQADA